MNKKQFSDRIGNIDDQLIQEAERNRNYSGYRRRQGHGLRRVASIAAVLLLMICSFSVGAIAFAKEIVIEVPVEQEIVNLEDIGISLILPDEWAGRYTVVEGTFEPYNSPTWEFCAKAVYESGSTDEMGNFFRGTLFTVFQYADRPLSIQEFEESDIAGIGRFLLATENATYVIMYATDVQFDYTDEAQTSEYSDLMYGYGGMKNNIQVVVHNALPEIP